MLKQLFSLRGTLDKRMSWMLGTGGALFVLFVWYLLTMGDEPFLSSAILPKPWRVFTAYSDLYTANDLIKNTCRSVGLNLAGYVEAILIAIPIGFIIGLYTFFRGGFHSQVDAMRYIPLTAVTGLFIVWFGVGTSMKVHFLAFGILIYLLPVIVQRIDEVKDVYLKTVYTLGASDWETIKTVYFPSVISRLSDDIRVLTAISWTYIIVAEGIGNEGGIGALIWRAGLRQGRIDKVFASLIIIMIIGVLQDKIFIRLDREFFPYKFQTKKQHQKSGVKKERLFGVVLSYAKTSFAWTLMFVYVVLFANEIFSFAGDFKPLSYLFGDTVWVIHFIMILTIFYQVHKLIIRRRENLQVPTPTT